MARALGNAASQVEGSELDFRSLPGLPVEHRPWDHLRKKPTRPGAGMCKLAGPSREAQVSLGVVEARLLEEQIPLVRANERGAAREVERELPVGELDEGVNDDVGCVQTVARLEGERSAWSSLAGTSDGACKTEAASAGRFQPHCRRQGGVERLQPPAARTHHHPRHRMPTWSARLHLDSRLR